MTEKEKQNRKAKLFNYEQGKIRVEEQYDENFQSHGVFMVSFDGNYIEGLSQKDLYLLAIGAKAAQQHAADRRLEPTNWPPVPS